MQPVRDPDPLDRVEPDVVVRVLETRHLHVPPHAPYVFIADDEQAAAEGVVVFGIDLDDVADLDGRFVFVTGHDGFGRSCILKVLRSHRANGMYLDHPIGALSLSTSDSRHASRHVGFASISART